MRVFEIVVDQFAEFENRIAGCLFLGLTSDIAGSTKPAHGITVPSSKPVPRGSFRSPIPAPAWEK